MNKPSKLQLKLKKLPISSGVYFHKDKKGEIIYVGKAAVLKNRVKQYFQNSRDMDAKTKLLVSEIADTDWVETETEIDALFLEAEMVKRYMPRYNILLRDDKSLTYIRIDMKSDWPYVGFTRNPADDEAEYFGPYYNSFAVKKALRFLRPIFPYFIKNPKTETINTRLDLDAHLGLSPTGMTTSEYKINLRKLISYIKGNRQSLIIELENDMKNAAKDRNFELAAKLRNKLFNLKELQRRIVFGDKEFLDISKDIALRDLTDLLNLKSIPKRIEGFDISHMGGTNVVASMVVFKNGISDRGDYRKFKTRIDKNDDFYNMKETLARRLSEKNLKSWGRPDLILIDGGKGQLDAALQALEESGQFGFPFIGLAKRDEQIVVKNNTFPPHATHGYNSAMVDEHKLAELGGSVEISDGYTLINLPKSSPIIKLLQRVRDESHRFAVSYHTILRRVKQTSSSLEEIPGIGPKTRAKLIRKFGSIRNLKLVPESDIISQIGISKAGLVIKWLMVV
jgi:excinuclease ABC subunit C